jgi:SNF2 family DNA or RNA helicase
MQIQKVYIIVKSNVLVVQKVLPMLSQVLNDKDVDFGVLMEQNWISSVKIRHMIQHLNEIKHTAKSIIFSQWTSMLDLVEIALTKANVEYVRFDGSMSRKDRDTTLQKFKNDPDLSVCLFSLKAGGIGLNLTEATTVFMLDPWWNPAIEEQAINRVHRIGQDQPVTIIRYIIKVNSKFIQK